MRERTPVDPVFAVCSNGGRNRLADNPLEDSGIEAIGRFMEWRKVYEGLLVRPAVPSVVRIAAAFGVLVFGIVVSAFAANPSYSKLSIHTDMSYTSGAQAIVGAHPRVLKIFFGSGMPEASQLQAASDYKAGTPAGKVVLRVYTTQSWQLAQDPTTSATAFFNNVLAPAINAMTPAQKALIDYLEGPNEGDSTPTFTTLAETQWFNTFWMQLAPLISNAGFKPLFGSISVGNPPGDVNTLHAYLDAMIPALRLCQSLGGALGYHDYAGPTMTKDVNTELGYSLRYRLYYAYFSSNYPDLASMPLICTEGGGYYDWVSFGAAYFEDWLAWHDQQIQQDPYFVADTLFEIGDPSNWPEFDLEPISGWLANHIATYVPPQPPPAPTGLAATAGNTTAALAWNTSFGAASYNVKRSTVSGGPYSTIATGVTTTTYLNTGLTNGTTYYYVVSAQNSYGESGASNQASATPSSACTNGSVSNGGFETGSASPWVIYGTTDGVVNSGTNGINAHAGSKLFGAWASYATKSGGAYQQIAVCPGSVCSASVWIYTQQSGGDVIDDLCRIGIDPAGGSNPASASIAWTAWFYAPGAWSQITRSNVTATAATATVFIEHWQKWNLPLNVTMLDDVSFSATGGGAPAPTITRSPAIFTPSCNQGGSAASQSFTVQNTGGQTLSYSIGVNQGWLSVTPTSGTSTGESDTITVNYATSGLAAGTYNATIAITAAGATNSPQSVGVALTVSAVTVEPDFDHDGDVDLADFSHLQACLTGTGVALVIPACADANLNGDNFVDGSDLAVFLGCFSGANKSAVPTCAN